MIGPRFDDGTLALHFRCRFTFIQSQSLFSVLAEMSQLHIAILLAFSVSFCNSVSVTYCIFSCFLVTYVFLLWFRYIYSFYIKSVFNVSSVSHIPSLIWLNKWCQCPVTEYNHRLVLDKLNGGSIGSYLIRCKYSDIAVGE